MKLKESRSLSFITILVVYVLAFIVGLLVWRGLENTGWHYLWRLFTADAVATVVVWFFGLIFRNVSVYDPYWSVVPPIMLTLWAVHVGSWTSATILLLVAVWYWGIRLTGNWAFTFKNLNSEDWRYTKYRTEQSPFIFHLINFFGLNMMPTVIVFLVMIPGFFVIDAAFSANLVTILGFLMCIAAATIQLISDTQRHRFAKSHRGEVCNVGLWKHGRHPNYFGEVMMWWGLFMMFISINIGNPQGYTMRDLCFIGPLLNSCLFCFISVPLMEKRQLQNKPGYAEYRKETRMFI
ncbi:MAG: DUF1295 domain-containing protein [Bacteroidales bacterium]|nr:DUF1295 domain-containing protein [Bacteroidales bacterium]